jgi:hypothetical protein
MKVFVDKTSWLDEKIPTPSGWTTIKDIKPGDYVFDSLGHKTKVIDTTDTFYDKICYKLIFSNNTSIVIDSEHLWLTTTNNDKTNATTEEHRTKERLYRKRKREMENREMSKSRKKQAKTRMKNNRKYGKLKPPKQPTVKTTEEIFNNLYRGKTHIRCNQFINTCKPIQLSEKEYLIDPYLLGIWLGDGCTASGKIATNDPEIFNYMNEEVVKNKTIFMYNIKGLQPKLKKLNLFKNKHIPSEYLRGSFNQRLDLLKGLMDSDGTIGKKGSLSFSNTNLEVINKIIELIRSLGLTATYLERTSFCWYKGEKKYCKNYVVFFSSDFPVFNLKRKLERQNLIRRLKDVVITHIEKIETVPIKNIIVNSPTHMFLTENFLPTHDATPI